MRTVFFSPDLAMQRWRSGVIVPFFAIGAAQSTKPYRKKGTVPVKYRAGEAR